MAARARHQCPICAREIPADENKGYGPSFPFCSKACKLIDLGRWLNGDYRFPADEESPLGGEHEAEGMFATAEPLSDSSTRSSNGRARWLAGHEEAE